MPSIVGKRRGKQTYYYLVESARVEGKPRIVSQQYLGSADEVMAKQSGAASGEPVRSQHKKFGDLAAVWSVLEDLDVIGLIDDSEACRRNRSRSTPDRPNASANSLTVLFRGRLTRPDSSSLIRRTLIPVTAANASCVRPSRSR